MYSFPFCQTVNCASVDLKALIVKCIVVDKLLNMETCFFSIMILAGAFHSMHLQFLNKLPSFHEYVLACLNDKVSTGGKVYGRLSFPIRLLRLKERLTHNRKEKRKNAFRQIHRQFDETWKVCVLISPSSLSRQSFITVKP